MLPGPVFEVELLTTARRPRYYAFRVIYGVGLLFIVWQNYLGWRYGAESELSFQQIKNFAQSTFYSLVGLQSFLILGMTPSLCAGVIANEKQRKTLHYLLASRLTSGEIVLGKLLARMLHVTVFLAIGLPIMTMLSLFGGVDPLHAVLVAVGSFSTAFFLASLAVLCSTTAKKVREAITATYALEAAWLMLPGLIRTAMPFYYPTLYSWIQPVNDVIWWSNPWPVMQSLLPFMGRATTPVESTLWMAGLQTGAAILMIALAILRLRPVFRAQEGSTSFRFLGIPLPGRKTRRIRLFGRRPIGDRAMIWKELFTSRTSGVAQAAGIFLGLIVAVAVAYGTLYFGADAFRELLGNPYTFADGETYSYGGPFRARQELNGFMRMITTAVSVVMILHAAVAGANTMTSEREDDTWISLVGTPLSNQEIVFAKMLGVLWKCRWGVALVAVEWLAGMACGAIHPFGVLFQAIELTCFLVFATALGTFFSTTSKSTWRSQTTTVFTLFMCSGGYFAFCCALMMFASRSGGNGIIYGFGCMPMILAVSLVPPWELTALVSSGNGGYGFREMGEFAAASVIGTTLYAVGGFALTTGAVWRFDKAADRPRRDEFAPSLPPKQPAKVPSAKEV